MAFNLNKNDESTTTGDLSKKSNSKFDLTKGDSKTIPPVVIEEKTNSSRWILISLLLLAVGIGGWYLLSNKQPSNTNAEETVTEAQAAEQTPSTEEPAVVQTETPAVQENNSAATTVQAETASDGNKTNASPTSIPSSSASTTVNSVSDNSSKKNNMSNSIQSDISKNDENESLEATKKITATLNKAALEEIQAQDTKPNHY